MADVTLPHRGKAEDRFLRLGVIVKVPFGEGSIEKAIAAIRATGVQIIHVRAARVPIFITDAKPPEWKPREAPPE